MPISVKSLDMFAIKLEYKQRMHMLGSLLHLQYSPFSIHIKKKRLLVICQNTVNFPNTASNGVDSKKCADSSS